MSFLAYIASVIIAVGSLVLGVEWLANPPTHDRPVHVASIPAQKSPADRKPASRPQASAPQVTVPRETATAQRPQTDGRASKDGRASDSETAVNERASNEPQDTNEPGNGPSPPAVDTTPLTPRSPPAPLLLPGTAARAAAPPDQAAAPPVQKAPEPPKTTVAVNDRQEARPVETTDNAAAPLPQQVAAGACDVRACSSMYSSFRASDCSYQPYSGPRRICTRTAANVASADLRGTDRHRADRPNARDAARPDYREGDRFIVRSDDDDEDDTPIVVRMNDPDADVADDRDIERADAREPVRTVVLREARAQAACHVDACAATYQSFDRSTCTYQPFEGGRRRTCEK